VENIPNNLKNMHESNMDIMLDLYDDKFIEQSIEGSLPTKKAIEANEVLADTIYGVAISSLIRNRQYKKLLSVKDDMAESLLSAEASLESLDINRIGLVLVRPEILTLADDCKKLLELNGLDVIFNKKIRVGLNQYMSLYPHAIAMPDSYYDFPTRTLNYINKESELIIVTNQSSSNLDNNLPISDFLSGTLRGKQGTYSANTLRGDISYKSLAGHINGSSISPQSSIALDPIGAYRHLVSGDIASNGVHNSVNIPLLFYAGQGVHTPNSEEIKRDLRILCDENDLSEITKKMQERSAGDSAISQLTIYP